MNEARRPATSRQRNEVTDRYFSFEKMISPTLIKVVYVIGMIGIVIAAIYMTGGWTR